MIRLTSSPATLPASLVAWRWSSLKYAGTVITAESTVSPSLASASALSFCRIIAEISGGEYCLPPALTRTSPFGPATTLYGTIVSSSLTSASLRPMKRLIEKIVFSGFITAWRLATVPTRRSPLSVNATTDGVVRPPSAFSRTVGSPPSITATHELVVPRSIPIVFATFAPTSRWVGLLKLEKSKWQYGRCRMRCQRRICLPAIRSGRNGVTDECGQVGGGTKRGGDLEPHENREKREKRSLRSPPGSAGAGRAAGVGAVRRHRRRQVRPRNPGQRDDPEPLPGRRPDSGHRRQEHQRVRQSQRPDPPRSNRQRLPGAGQGPGGGDPEEEA